MASKAHIRKKKSTDFVNTSATTHKERLANRFVEVISGPDKERMRQAVHTLIDGILHTRHTDFALYQDAENALATERLDDAEIVRARNEALSRVISLLVEVRQGALMADENLPAKLGFKGPTPREANAVLATAQFVVKSLSETGITRSKTLRGYVFNPADYTELTHAVRRLERAQTAYIADGRENDAALVARNRAEAVQDHSLSAAMTLLSALFKIAGEDLLASRVGAPGRKSGTVAEFDAEDDGEEAPEAEAAG